MKIAAYIAQLIEARDNCRKSGNTEWEMKHATTLSQIVAADMPSGSGWDNGTSLEASSTPTKLVFSGSYHHMNDGGYYDGWTDHSIIVTPRFHGVDIRVTGWDRNQIKDYLAELFSHVLNQDVEPAR